VVGEFFLDLLVDEGLGLRTQASFHIDACLINVLPGEEALIEIVDGLLGSAIVSGKGEFFLFVGLCEVVPAETHGADPHSVSLLCGKGVVLLRKVMLHSFLTV
jgi:hypothetical protein